MWWREERRFVLFSGVGERIVDTICLGPTDPQVRRGERTAQITKPGHREVERGPHASALSGSIRIPESRGLGDLAEVDAEGEVSRTHLGARCMRARRAQRRGRASAVGVRRWRRAGRVGHPSRGKGGRPGGREREEAIRQSVRVFLSV
eukprot:scaffold302477_cov31-Tisochrysis_lutea.AAC.4